jgi:putative transposase
MTLFSSEHFCKMPPVPRQSRSAPGGIVYHALNRANGRVTLFTKPQDYDAFLAIVRDTLAVVPTRLLAYIVMPNHFHLALWPRADGELSEFMRRLTVTHAMRWHAHRGSGGSGHVYQNRFKSFPCERDEHLLVLLRYVERNALRAGLVRRAEVWRWSSLWARLRGPPALSDMLSEWPIDAPRDWVELVNRPQTAAEEQALRRAIARSSPFGSDAWARRTATRLGLEWTLRPRGRPRKEPAG